MGRRHIAIWIGLGLLGAGLPAGASTQTLARSVGNIVLAPVDLALSPVVAGHAIYQNLQTAEDPPAVKWIFVVPGFAWNTGVQVLSSAIRELAGLLEFLPGLALLPSDYALEPLFDAVERGDALVDHATPVLHFKVGVDYTSR